jgi:hypothetical protein
MCFFGENIVHKLLFLLANDLDQVWDENQWEDTELPSLHKQKLNNLHNDAIDAHC